MITVIRKHQQGLMFVVALLTIVSFAWLYNPAKTEELGANVAARVYGRTYSQADIDRLVRVYELAIPMGQLEMVSGLGGMARSEEEVMSEFVWNLLVLRHEAVQMGVVPTDEQIAKRLREVTSFQTAGQFDPAKFEAFVRDRLGPRGMTAWNLEELMRDALRFERVKQIVSSPAAVGADELMQAQRFSEPADIRILRFPIEPLLASVEVTEADAQSYFEKNKEMFVAPETISLQYALFQLPESAKSAEGRDRVMALQELAGKAAAFAESAQADTFEAAATAAGATVKTSAAYDRRAATQSPDGLPSAVAQGAFLLTADRVVSDVTQAGDDFFVFRIASRTPERPLTFDEVRPEIEARLRQIAARKTLGQNAAATIATIRTSLATGTPLADAVVASGVESEEYPGVVPTSPNLPSDLMPLSRLVPLLEPGQISNVVPLATGGAAVAVMTRALAPDPSNQQDLKRQLLDSKRDLFFASWMSSRREAANITLPRRNRP